MYGGFIEGFLVLLLWLTWVVLNLWIWQKAKSQGNLLMMIGAGLIALLHLLGLFNAYLGTAHFWLYFIGLILLTVGFFLSVKPMVAAQIGALQSKFKGGGSSPANASHPSNPPNPSNPPHRP